jgi:hypothetical protein
MNNRINATVKEKQSETIQSTQLFYREIKLQSTDFDCIVIKNDYTHIINIFQLVDEKWKCILGEYKLMNEPDCDAESESYTVIYKKQFTYFDKNSQLLRIYMQQEFSPKIWKQFDIQSIKFYNNSINNQQQEMDDNKTDSNSISTNNPSQSKIFLNKLTNSFEITLECDKKIIIPTDKDILSHKYIDLMKGTSDINMIFLK